MKIKSYLMSHLHWTRYKSNFQTSSRSSGRRRGTRWCRSCRWTWRCQVGCRCTCPRWWRSHLCDTSRQKLRQRWKKERAVIFWICANAPQRPVIHEEVGFPDVFWGDSDVANLPVIRLVPLQIYVLPFLEAIIFTWRHYITETLHKSSDGLSWNGRSEEGALLLLV